MILHLYLRQLVTDFSKFIVILICAEPDNEYTNIFVSYFGTTDSCIQQTVGHGYIDSCIYNL